MVPSGSKLTCAAGTFTNNSDARLKTNINLPSDNYDILFDNLQPRTYELLSDPNKTSLGFVAQEVQSAIGASGLTEKELQIIHKDSEYYSLAYLEFIALNTWQIQKLKTRVNELEEKLAQLEAKLS
jgi:hypothetical protein